MKNKINATPTIFVVDDDVHVCKALKWLFESVKLQVEIFEDPLVFLEHYNPLRTGCILLDVRMPGMNGMEVLEQLRIRQNSIPVIVLTGHGDIPMAVRAMKAGAADFISKPLNNQHLLEEVQKIISKNMNQSEPAYLANAAERFASLNEKERKVMAMIVNGKMNKQMAEELGVAVSTIEMYRSRIKQKMNIRSLAQLIRVSLSLQM